MGSQLKHVNNNSTRSSLIVGIHSKIITGIVHEKHIIFYWIPLSF